MTAPSVDYSYWGPELADQITVVFEGVGYTVEQVTSNLHIHRAADDGRVVGCTIYAIPELMKEGMERK